MGWFNNKQAGAEVCQAHLGYDSKGWEGRPNWRFYNNFKPILQSTIRPKIYNLQSTSKIWQKSTRIWPEKNAV